MSAAPSPDGPWPAAATAARQRRAGYTLVALQTLPTLAIAALVSVLPRLQERYATVPHAQWLVPMILTMPSLCVALFSSWLGFLSDRWGRRSVLLPSLLGFALFGLAPFLVEGLFAIIATRFVVGVAEAGVLTVGNSLIGDYFDEGERQLWLGRQTIAGPIAAFIYVAAGGALGTWSVRGPFLLYLVGLLILVPALWTLPEPPRSGASRARLWTTPFPWKTAGEVALVTVLVSIVFFVQNVQHGRIFGDLGAGSPQRIAWVINAAGIGSLIGGVVYAYAKPQPFTRWLTLILLCYGVGYGVLGWVPNYLWGIPFDGLGQFASGLTIPSLIAWMLARYPLEHRGRGTGLWAASFFMGQFLSPPTVTALAHGRWTFLHTVSVIGLLCLLGALATALTAARGGRGAPAAG